MSHPTHDTADTGPLPRVPPGPVLALVKTLRPHQWVKNVFVAAPLVFSQHLGRTESIARTAIAVLAFCLLSGAVYCFNDVLDVEADRAHPKKKHRPIASGALSERAALIAAVVLAIIALSISLALSWKLAIVAAVYGTQNIAYSIKLKHVAFLDVGLIAFGFILRVLAGAYAIGVPASWWLIACTALLATFLGLGKRAHELAWAQRTGSRAATRAALAGYSMRGVKVAMYVLAVATCASYVMYTLDPHTREMFKSDRLVFSAPWVGLGLVRFILIALRRPRDESPTEAMLKDPWFLSILACAVGTILFAIYGR